MGLSLNLEKGLSLNLNKEFGKLDKINLGLGWDTKMDLDAFAILSDQNGKKITTVYYGRKSSHGVSLSGDNLTGEGDGDDETIFVNLDRLSSDVAKISLFANIFSAGSRTFNQVEGSFIRLVNGNTNEELAKYSLKDKSRNFNAFHFADLTVENGEFVFTIIGEGLNGSIGAIEKQFEVTNGNPSINQNQSPKAKGIFSGLFGKN